MSRPTASAGTVRRTDPAKGTLGQTRKGIPSWNGEPEKLDSHSLDAKMFIMSVCKSDRNICGPQLIRGLGVRVKPHAEAYGSLDNINEVNEAGDCAGWWGCSNHLLKKLNLDTMPDVGPSRRTTG